MVGSVERFEVVPGVGLEPTRITPTDFKSVASANSATPALPPLLYLLVISASTRFSYHYLTLFGWKILIKQRGRGSIIECVLMVRLVIGHLLLKLVSR